MEDPSYPTDGRLTYEGIAMTPITHLTRKVPGLSVAGLIALIATPAVWAAPSTDTVTVRATELQNKADHYSDLASFYRSLAKPGTKHLITYFTAANRADRLAERYHLAAAEVGRSG
jgi:hypothetical protein